MMKADWIMASLQKHGVDTSAIQRSAGMPTSATILNVRPNGERPALHARGAPGYFQVPEPAHEQVFDAPIIMLGGTGLLARLDGENGLALLKEAKRRGRTTVFDLIGAAGDTAANILPLLPHIDYFMPSIEEARAMSGLRNPGDCANFFLSRGAACCIFTKGSDGAYYARRDGTRILSPAYDVEVVDTTGCGDAFDAGFMAAMHHGMDLESSLRFAHAAGGLVATGLGSDAGIVSFEDTKEKMRCWKIKR